MSIRLRVAAVLAITAALCLAGLSRTWVPPARADAASSGQIVRAATCHAALSSGSAYVSRTTAQLAHRWYVTSVVLSSTGDPYALVVDRVMGYDANGNVMRRARGITGVVAGTRSWSFHSRTPDLAAHIAGVDQDTGAIVRVNC